MKTLVKIAALALMVAPMFMSCSGDGSGGASSLLLGGLPAQYQKMDNENEALKEKLKDVSSESEMASLMEKSKELKEEWKVKIEKSAQALDGREIKIADGQIKITRPLTLTFTGFFSQLDLTPDFKIDGAAEAAEDLRPEGKYALEYYTVYIVGLDSEGQETFASKVGMIKAEVSDDAAVIKAGTPVEFDRLQFSPKKIEGYQTAISLTLEARSE